MVRLVDVGELGQGTPDPAVLTYCADHGYVWMTTDQRAQAHITQWLKSGRTLPGAVIALQRHRITPGRLLRFLEDLAAEEVPFAGVIPLRPSGMSSTLVLSCHPFTRRQS